MQKISIVVDVRGKIFKTCVQKKILTLTVALGLGLG